ncbi:hypothetical protein A2U01_0063277, partial [Trifolium medium]|nr:hypothetical protein [Trifolium medium]
DRIEYEAIMDRNEAVFYEQYGSYAAQMRAQEEESAVAAANAGTPEFTYSELGLRDPVAFNNFMNPDPPADG